MKLFSSADFKPSLEQLELEKLLEKKSNHHGNLDFEDVYEDVKEQVDRKEESDQSEKKEETGDTSAPPSDPSEETQEPGERVSGEEPSDSDDPDSTNADEAEELHDPETEDAPAEKISAESLREIMKIETTNLLGIHAVSFEDFGGDPYVIRPSLGEKAWSLSKSAIGFLGFLGIKLTTEILPKILTHTFKGVVYGFTRLAYGVMISIQAIDQYLHRRINSFNNLRANIQKAKETLDLLAHSKVDGPKEGDAYTDSRGIRAIAAGDSVDPARNLELAIQFIEHSIDGLGVSIKQDVSSILALISSVRPDVKINTDDLLKIDLKIKDAKAGSLPGFATNNPLLKDLHTVTPMPGNVALIAHLPSDEPKDREGWVQAYRESQIFLGVNKSTYVEHHGISYMSVDDMKKLVGALERLCLLCIKHQAFYEHLKRQKLDQKTYFRNYFEKLLKQDKKLSIKDTLIDLVGLKTHFIDKVYLPAAIDIHDYGIRVINAYLKYLQKNIRQLAP